MTRIHSPKRLCIFSFYDPKGTVDRSVEYYLDSILEIASSLVIVINGTIGTDDLKKLQNRTTQIYIRENAGYDAGAYKDCMFNYIGIEEIRKYDELIMANDTVIGPLVPFTKIFGEMANKKCDFWGIDYIKMGGAEPYTIVVSSVSRQDSPR